MEGADSSLDTSNRLRGLQGFCKAVNAVARPPLGVGEDVLVSALVGRPLELLGELGRKR